MTSRLRIPALLAAAALTVAAAGCGSQDPKPVRITVLSGKVRTDVPAQPACTMLKVGGCGPQADAERTIRAAGGSQLQLDVPSALAKAGWIATAYTTDGTVNTPLQSPAGVSTGTEVGVRTVTLNVPSQTTGSYYLQVTALRPSTQLTNWLCLIQFTK